MRTASTFYGGRARVANFTLDQLEDFLGKPIILLQWYRVADKTHHELTVRDLPPAAITAIVNFINNHWEGA
jgi:hypothetical protein